MRPVALAYISSTLDFMTLCSAGSAPLIRSSPSREIHRRGIGLRGCTITLSDLSIQPAMALIAVSGSRIASQALNKLKSTIRKH